MNTAEVELIHEAQPLDFLDYLFFGFSFYDINPTLVSLRFLANKSQDTMIDFFLEEFRQGNWLKKITVILFLFILPIWLLLLTPTYIWVLCDIYWPRFRIFEGPKQ